jgi:threonine dehydrogenase-like Zn-dependent dehydrogenase
MKAVAVLEPAKPAKIACVDIPEPPVSDYECLVRVHACGICSSTDLKIAHGEHPVVPDFPLRYPLILGHEGAGEIVKIGKKVRSFKVGQRVVCPVVGFGIPGCNYHMGYGGMVEYSKAADYRVMKEDGIADFMVDSCPEEIDFITKVFPDNIDYVDATMILSFKENYSALRNFGVKEGMDILIFGDGSICMGLCLFLRSYRVNSVTVIGHHDERLANIKDVSHPDLLINSNKKNIGDRLKNKKFDIVIDAVGSMEIVRQGAGLLKPGGKVCVYGVLAEGKSTLDLYGIPNYTAVQIMSYPYKEHRTHADIIELMRRGLVRPKDFYSHVLPVEQAAEGIRMLEAREAFKVILTF